MVNTRKGSYAAKSSEDDLEARISSPSMHNMRMRGHVAVERPIDAPVSDHAQENSSTEGVFVPTPGLQHTSTFEPGPSLYSSLVQSPTPHSTSSSLKNDPASPPADETAALERGTDVHNDDDELDPVIPKVNTCEIPVDVDVDNTLAAPTESPAFPEISRPAKKKLQQN
ncbi:envelope-like protein [Cucumis melo var. makuwa]|uniref:Envelope-like protein n=1 Tax=Cucumis melo var. makuwa TaxID=1194695 RepID=A0A5D3C2V7_CUCMM|nr:envelope-like protein [Cucumis melo var. makuwa]